MAFQPSLTKNFVKGEEDKTVVTGAPALDLQRRLVKRWPGARFDPLEGRLIRCSIDTGAYNFANTFPIAGPGSAAGLSDLYIGRWSIEELNKISKQTIAMDPFHGYTECRVHQQIYAHFNLISLTRLFSGPGDAWLNERAEEVCDRQTANLSHTISMVPANIAVLLLARAETVPRMTESIPRTRQRLRPRISKPRRSHKPTRK